MDELADLLLELGDGLVGNPRGEFVGQRPLSQLGRQRRFLKNFGLTVAATSILLGTLGFIAYEPGDEFFSTRTDLTGFGFLLGAYLGVPLGALIGYLVKEERWNPASLPAPR